MKFNKIFCRHKNGEVVCWHLTHGINDNKILFLEIQLKCVECGRYYFRYIWDWGECEEFISKHKDKRWSENCKPVLNY